MLELEVTRNYINIFDCTTLLSLQYAIYLEFSARARTQVFVNVLCCMLTERYNFSIVSSKTVIMKYFIYPAMIFLLLLSDYVILTALWQPG